MDLGLGPAGSQNGPAGSQNGPSWSEAKLALQNLSMLPLGFQPCCDKKRCVLQGFWPFCAATRPEHVPNMAPHGPNKPQDDMGPTWPQDGPQHGTSRPSQPSPTAILAWKWVLPEILYSRERLRRVLRKKAAVVIHLHTLTFADLHLHTLTSADLHLHTFTSADLHLHTLTSADLHLHTLTSADLHFTPSHLLIYIFTPSHLLNTSSHPHIC